MEVLTAPCLRRLTTRIFETLDFSENDISLEQENFTKEKGERKISSNYEQARKVQTT